VGLILLVPLLVLSLEYEFPFLALVGLDRASQANGGNMLDGGEGEREDPVYDFGGKFLTVKARLASRYFTRVFSRGILTVSSKISTTEDCGSLWLTYRELSAESSRGLSVECVTQTEKKVQKSVI
jgi:hypothetical protein